MSEDKVCGRCGESVPPEKQRGSGTWCKPCHIANTRAWQDANPERAWAMKVAGRLRRLGVDTDTDRLLAWWALQEKVCRICGEEERVVHRVSGTRHELSVDHCHRTGRLRGLLCGSCNRAIGLLRDDPQLMMRAAEYVGETVGAQEGALV